MERAKGALFVPAYDLAKARATARLGEEAPIVTKALTATVLVVDDLGSEPNFPTSAVPEILHERHADGKQTIVTTGFSSDEIATRYGSGIARRLFERTVKLRVG